MMMESITYGWKFFFIGVWSMIFVLVTPLKSTRWTCYTTAILETENIITKYK